MSDYWNDVERQYGIEAEELRDQLRQLRAENERLQAEVDEEEKGMFVAMHRAKTAEAEIDRLRAIEAAARVVMQRWEPPVGEPMRSALIGLRAALADIRNNSPELPGNLGT